VTILVMEPNADLRDIMCFMLRRGGHRVISASDGAIGLRHWETKAPDLVVLEAEMPCVSGWEIVRLIRRTSDIPVMMLTNSSADSDIVRGFDLGADDMVTKPFSPRVLAARVQAIMRRRPEPTDEGPKVSGEGRIIRLRA
jgi:DNA-binding response OmpR family regulator